MYIIEIRNIFKSFDYYMKNIDGHTWDMEKHVEINEMKFNKILKNENCIFKEFKLKKIIV